MRRIRIFGNFTLHPLPLLLVILAAILWLCVGIVELLVAPGAAQETPSSCSDRSELVLRAISRGEVQRQAWVGETGMIFEVWGNVETQTVSVFITRPGGLTCALTGNSVFGLPEDVE